MKEYQRHLDFYTKKYWFSTSSEFVHYKSWGNKELANDYLQKFWLSEHEYLSFWKPIQDKIFVEGKNLPNLIYQAEFEIMALMGGSLFMEEDFTQLQKAMQVIGEENFVIIQHSQDFTEGEPMFRMKFPVNITWEELTSGNYISAILLEMNYNNYLVFGSKGNWGKYAANDYENPVDIIGFNPKIAAVFREYFKQSWEEHEEIRELLPQEYKGIIT